MAAEPLLDLDRDLPVTAADVEAQRRLRADLPSWFALDWKQIADIVGPGARCPSTPRSLIPKQPRHGQVEVAAVARESGRHDLAVGLQRQRLDLVVDATAEREAH